MSEVYLPNVLRRVRNSPPSYVLELLANDDLEKATAHLRELKEMNLAGVVNVDQRTDYAATPGAHVNGGSVGLTSTVLSYSADA